MTVKPQPMQGRLTIKQEKFCREYASSGNAVKSYISAYEKNNSYSAAGVESHRLLKNPKIQARLKELDEVHKTKKIAQAEEIQIAMTDLLRNGTSKEKLKAAEILCKIKGMFVSKQELEITNSVPIVIKDNV